MPSLVIDNRHNQCPHIFPHTCDTTSPQCKATDKEVENILPKAFVRVAVGEDPEGRAENYRISDNNSNNNNTNNLQTTNNNRAKPPPTNNGGNEK